MWVVTHMVGHRDSFNLLRRRVFARGYETRRRRRRRGIFSRVFHVTSFTFHHAPRDKISRHIRDAILLDPSREFCISIFSVLFFSLLFLSLSLIFHVPRLNARVRPIFTRLINTTRHSCSLKLSALLIRSRFDTQHNVPLFFSL